MEKIKSSGSSPAIFGSPVDNGFPMESYSHYALIFGIGLGSMLIGFVGYMDTVNIDLYFKILVNVLAVVLLIRLGVKLKRRLN